MIAEFDPEIDTWLREIAGESYPQLRDWLAVTWPEQIPPKEQEA